MKAVIARLVAGPLRYAARLVLQRPWLKRRVRGLVTHMPSVHKLVMRVMFQAPATGRSRTGTNERNLSPNARRAQRALKQAIRTHRR